MSATSSAREDLSAREPMTSVDGFRCVEVDVVHGADEWHVSKRDRYAPVMTRVHCTHPGTCPHPMLVELPQVPMRIVSPRVLRALALDWLDSA